MGLIIGLVFRLFFELPLLRTIALTIVPALLLLRYVRSKDRLEPEPPKLIWSLVGLGGLSIIPAVLLEMGGSAILIQAADTDSVLYRVIYWFVVVGLSEELSKYVMLRLRTWKSPDYNCLFDGMVYAVAVSAGFALVENVIYLFRYGASVVFIRAVVSIPAHICFSVFMGVWYSAAKKYQIQGVPGRMRRCRRLAVLLPALTHGLFDLIADSSDVGFGLIIFGAYVIAMFIVSWRLIKKLASEDAFIHPYGSASGA